MVYAERTGLTGPLDFLLNEAKDNLKFNKWLYMLQSAPSSIQILDVTFSALKGIHLAHEGHPASRHVWENFAQCEKQEERERMMALKHGKTKGCNPFCKWKCTIFKDLTEEKGTSSHPNSTPAALFGYLSPLFQCDIQSRSALMESEETIGGEMRAGAPGRGDGWKENRKHYNLTS